jgi:hypothetical protein
MIGHKCLEATICSKVLVDVYKAFSPGLTYVMLSKVTERRHLKIVHWLHLDDFIPILYSGTISTIFDFDSYLLPIFFWNLQFSIRIIYLYILFTNLKETSNVVHSPQ